MKTLTGIVTGLLVASCSPGQSSLDSVKQAGELRVLTHTSPTTYFVSENGPAGLEYELARRFAAELEVELKIIPATTPDKILRAISRGAADVAVGLPVTSDYASAVRFGPPYQQITQQLVYREGNVKPTSLDDVSGKLEIAAESIHSNALVRLREKHPRLGWQEHVRGKSEDLMERVWEHRADYTIADSNMVALVRRFYPELRVAFDLGEPQSLAWGFPATGDDSLYRAAHDFFGRLQASGELGQLIERHYGHMAGFDYVATRRFIRHIDERLPKLRNYFEAAADQHRLDWRLLAAVAYQESHWNPDAVSPTGVKGVMMLTNGTAKQVGIKDRSDPEQSILGGADYLVKLRKRLTEEIREPDRTWFTLAAYNVGLGHLRDARILARDGGANPNRWVDVKEYLPLLRKEEWFKKTKYGFARGDEPVVYVGNIRRYFDMLVGFERKKTKQRAATLKMANG